MLKPRRPMEFLLIAAFAVAAIAVYFSHPLAGRDGVVIAGKKDSVLPMRGEPAPPAADAARPGR